MRDLDGWQPVHLLGPVAAGIGIFVVATSLDGHFDSGAPLFRDLPSTTVVWLSTVAIAVLTATWYLASRGHGLSWSSRARRSTKRRRE